jgi:hypothetical protein
MSVTSIERFTRLSSIQEKIKDFDWFVYFDADMYCNEEILYEIFFDENKKFFAVQHPLLTPLWERWHPYDNRIIFEENSNSSAYISLENRDDTYVQGCLSGR